MKKIMVFLLVCIMILSSIPVLAEENVIISSITDGAVLAESPKEVTLSVGAGYDCIILLDGEVISEFVSEGDDTVAIEKEAEVGKHTLVAIVSKDDDIYTHKIEFERTYSGIDTGSTIYVNQEKLLAVNADKVSKEAGYDKDGNQLTISKALFDGKDGENGGAVGFKTSGILASIDGAKHIHLPLYWSGATLSGIIEIEYDLKIEGKMRFEFETSGSAGYGNFGPDNMINNGKIAGEMEYESGVWYHFRQVVNLDTKRQDLYVDGELIKGNFAVKNPENINTVKVQVRGDVADAVSAVMIDNFSFGNPYTVKAGEKAKYKKGDEFADIDSDILKEETTSFRLLAEGAKSGDASVTVLADGEEIEKVSGKVDGEGNIDFTISETLPKEADIKFLADGGDWTLLKTIKNRVGDFGVKDVSFKIGSIDVFSAKQLERDCTLDANFTLYNSGESRKAVVIATVYEGDKLVSISSKTCDFVSGEPTAKVSLDIPDREGEYTAECYLFDSLPSRKPLSKIWYLN